MFHFLKRHKISFHRPDRDTFHLDTSDVSEGVSFLGGGRHKDAFSRYIAAGGTRDSRDSKGIEQLLIRSRFRFAIILTLLVIIWILGTVL
ncbi:MAG: hypothetical protein Q4C03_03515 [bacterium]|nr:hypothetical protein [bacterium]